MFLGVNFPKIMDIPVILFVLTAVIIIYACFGTPTPSRLGVTEAAIGALLFLSIFPFHLAPLFMKETGKDYTPRWFLYGRILLWLGLFVPLLTGLLNDNNIFQILRDIVPFLFLMAPVLFYRALAKHIKFLPYLTVLICGLGLVFSFRTLSPAARIIDDLWQFEIIVSDPDFLINSPLVLCSALMLAGIAGYLITLLPQRPTKIATGVFLAVLSLVPLSAMALVQQRATIGLFCMAMLILGGRGILNHSYRAFIPLVIVAVLVWLDQHRLLTVFYNLAEKTNVVGLNQRGAEWQTVLSVVQSSGWHSVFGMGWGALIDSPAVGGASVNFTHNIISSFLLKGGVLGVALVVPYLFYMGMALWQIARYRLFIAIALGFPFLINVSLYASFKSLDFGILLLMIVLWREKAVQSIKQRDQLPADDIYSKNNDQFIKQPEPGRP